MQNVIADVQMQGKDGQSESWGTHGAWHLDSEVIYHGLADEYLDITPNNSGEMSLATERYSVY